MAEKVQRTLQEMRLKRIPDDSKLNNFLVEAQQQSEDIRVLENARDCARSAERV